MRDRQPVHPPGDRHGVPCRDRIERPDAEGALAAAVVVVRLRQSRLETVVGRDQRPGPVAGEVRPQHAEPPPRAGPPGLVQHGVGVGERRRAPGRVRMEAVGLVEQHALGTLDDHRPV